MGLLRIVGRIVGEVGVWTGDVTYFYEGVGFFVGSLRQGAMCFYLPLLNRHRVRADSKSNTNNNFAVERPRFLFTDTE